MSQTLLALLPSLHLLSSGCVLLAASGTFLHSLSFVCLGCPWPGQPAVSQESQIPCSCCLPLCDLGGGHVTLVMMVPKRGGGGSLGERYMGGTSREMLPSILCEKIFVWSPQDPPDGLGYPYKRFCYPYCLMQRDVFTL